MYFLFVYIGHLQNLETNATLYVIQQYTIQLFNCLFHNYNNIYDKIQYYDHKSVNNNLKFILHGFYINIMHHYYDLYKKYMIFFKKIDI